MTAKDWLIDKVVDILVVITGILVALSIESCRESQKALGQWRSYARQFQVDVDEFRKTNPEIIADFSKKVDDADRFLRQIESTRILSEGQKDFLISMGMIRIEYPTSTLYTSLVQSGNPNLINDADRVRWLGQFYYFEKVVLLKAGILSDNFIPEYKRVIGKVEQHYTLEKDISSIRSDLKLVVGMYRGLMANFKELYESQEKNRLEVEKIL